MKHRILLVLISLILFSGAAGAESPEAAPADQGHRDEIGLGLGAIIGGLIAGPPGAIIGAAGGAWYGNREDREAAAGKELETELTKKRTEVAYLNKQLAELRSEFGRELQKVKLQDRSAALQELSQGLTMTVYFRTDSARVDEDVQADIRNLAGFLKDYPEIQLHLEAHADRRGSDDYNRELSRRRALAVREALLAAGIESARIHSHAYGESRAERPAGDREGLIFDRRVNIVLNLDTQA
jgi:outer membrane protein OmpA-like peptidoglycan-associated protein